MTKLAAEQMNDIELKIQRMNTARMIYGFLICDGMVEEAKTLAEAFEKEFGEKIYVEQ